MFSQYPSVTLWYCYPIVSEQGKACGLRSLKNSNNYIRLGEDPHLDARFIPICRYLRNIVISLCNRPILDVLGNYAICRPLANLLYGN